jgi:plastocyanin
LRTPFRRSIVAAAIAALLLAACGGDDQESGSDETTPPTAETTAVTNATSTTEGHDGMAEPDKEEFKIVGKNIAFDPDKLTIPVGKEVEIVFDNRDASVPHNIHFRTPKDVKSDLKEGKSAGVRDRLKLKVDEAGTYEFLCDVHPTMKGELTVK